MKWFILGALVLMLILIAIPLGAMCGFGNWFISRSVDVVKEEVDPRVLLDKYMWFKDASAQLDSFQANISIYESRLRTYSDMFTGTLIKDWPRDAREQYSLWMSENAGVKAAYNKLAAEYNAQMAKINWAFTNVGELPKGAERPLPREYKPYTLN